MFKKNEALSQLKKEIVESKIIVTGIVKSTAKSFGFLECTNDKDYFIPPDQMKLVLNGDSVEATVKKNNDRHFIIIEKVINSSIDKFIGKIKIKDKNIFVEPESISDKKWVFLLPNHKLALKEGDYVNVKLSHHPFSNKGRSAVTLVNKIGSAGDNNLAWEYTKSKMGISDHMAIGLPHDKVREVITQSARNRLDMTSVPFITIDGESTKDIDDAIYVEKLENQYKLVVAIADPTLIFKVDNDLHNEFKKQSSTYYLPSENIPMMPRELSEDIFSLVENQVRPALCCEMLINSREGNVEKYSFYEAMIKSNARLSYNDVSHFIKEKSNNYKIKGDIANQVNLLHELTHCRFEWRSKNTNEFPNRKDFFFTLDEDMKVTGVREMSSNIAHYMVEEAMVAANISVGSFLKENKSQGIFNTHAGFKKSSVNKVKEIIGLDIDVNSLDGFALANKIFLAASPKKKSLLRGLFERGSIEIEPKPHLAMGIDSYATFTSPIRKYGDMLNHLLIKSAIGGECFSMEEGVASCIEEAKAKQGRSQTEVKNWLYAEYMETKVGKAFNAEIRSFNKFGLSVYIVDNGAMGFIPSSFLKKNRNDKVSVDEEGNYMINDIVLFELGQDLTVSLKEVNHDRRSLLFEVKKIELGTVEQVPVNATQ